MANGKPGIFAEPKAALVDWLDEKVDGIHDRYAKSKMSSFYQYSLTSSLRHFRFRFLDHGGKNKITESWAKVHAKMSDIGNTCKSAKQWQKHWDVYKKQVNNKYD